MALLYLTSFLFVFLGLSRGLHLRDERAETEKIKPEDIGYKQLGEACVGQEWGKTDCAFATVEYESALFIEDIIQQLMCFTSSGNKAEEGEEGTCLIPQGGYCWLTSIASLYKNKDGTTKAEKWQGGFTIHYGGCGSGVGNCKRKSDPAKFVSRKRDYKEVWNHGDALQVGRSWGLNEAARLFRVHWREGKRDQGGFEDLFQFFVAPPSVNSSVTVFSTQSYSVGFTCAEEDGEIFGLFLLDVKPQEEEFAFITGLESLSGTYVSDVLVPCANAPDNSQGGNRNGLVVVPPNTALHCVLMDSRDGEGNPGVPADSTEVDAQRAGYMDVRFADGSQFVSGDNFAAVIVTGAERNETLVEDFGIPSACAAFGSIFVKVPKGLGFSEGDMVDAAKGDAEKKTDEGFGDFFPFKDLSDGLKFELPDLGGFSSPSKDSFQGAKGKGPFKGVVSYYLNSPAINSTVTVLSTPLVDLEFNCLERDGRVYGQQSLNLNSRSVMSDDTNVEAEDLDDFHLRFENGLQIQQHDEEVASVVTGTEGNSNFTQFFKAPSSCVTFGPIILDIPKGVPFEVNSNPPAQKYSSDLKDTKDLSSGGFKLDGLSDSLNLDFDLSGLSSGGLGGKGDAILKGKKDILQYFEEVLGIFFMTVKAGKSDLAFIVENDDGDTTDTFFGIRGRQAIDGPQNDLVIVPAGEELVCFLEEFGTGDLDDGPNLNETGILVQTDDEVMVQFSDGFQFTIGDQSTPIILTGVDGNSTLTDSFGVPSSCAAFGYVNFLIPKGEKVNTLGGPGGLPSAGDLP
uniref:Uncharacterized protein n=1 Tax=Chromera velia CCMP2878 TaxID=1169474 RepID=A0A0K6S9L9_9ALVE|eukprot:Cvel_7708.t2-p1 / transcript=Cvel_7708.t2 / gene=Cvel_7708 / organism=Chromera_velia_CCMP2878 / gene_product=hypothetical protein / transcript_product=hypothetical protein / location=Cvel_scaffold409:60609-66495(+) / protein_length=792 / sequence_SO=supercontig / SO=protein_coding / is_pseudo=false